MSRVKRVTDDNILAALADITGAKRLGQTLDPVRHHPFASMLPLPLCDGL
jgi:hypothetical protein